MKKYSIWLWIVFLAALNATAQVTEIHTFNSVNKSVPDGNPSGVADSRIIPSAISTISDVKVRLQVSGEFNGDLYGYVTHSSGLTVLLNRPGKTAGNAFGYADSGFDITFDDAAVDDVHLYGSVTTPAAGSPLTGTWMSDGRKVHPSIVTDATPRSATLSEFVGLDADGTWTLFLADMESGGTNQLDGWELEITGQATPTITWPTPLAITYGTALSGTELSASASVPGTFVYSPTTGTVLDAGGGQTLSVTFTPTDATSYAVVNADVAIDVGQAPLIIAAISDSKTYGSANPLLAASYSGFVNGDDAGDLDSPAILATTATSGSPVSTYPISVVGAADPNYDVTMVPGVLTVTAAALQITADDAARNYGAPNPAFTLSYSGFVNGDGVGNLDTAASVSTTATVGSPVGSYPVSAGGAADANYSISYVDGTLSVGKAALTIAANDKSKTYGDANPALTVSYTGFVNGDGAGSLDTGVSISTSATPGSPVGSYPITPSGAVDGNYSIAFVNGNLTVDPAALTITANDKSKDYGDSNPTLTVSYSGFVNGDSEGGLDTPVVISTTAQNSSPVGSYPITASTASDANYTVSFVEGTLTVNSAALIIAADDKSRLFGEANPALTVSYSGFVNGDTPANLDVPVSISTTAVPSSPVGGYPITASSASDANYDVSFEAGTMTVSNAASSGLLASSSTLIAPNASLTLTATMSAVAPATGTPTGNVQFQANGAALGGSVAVVGGVAQLVTTDLTLGSYAITADYAGDGNFGATSMSLASEIVVNTPPESTDDTIDRYRSRSVKVLLAALLENDSDADEEVVTLSSIDSLSNLGGSVVQAGAWVIYTAPEDYNDSDTFTYTIEDPIGQQSTATVNIQVIAGNTITENLTITDLGAGSFNINLFGIPNEQYGLEFTDTIEIPIWNHMLDVTTDDLGQVNHIDTPPGGVSRFYRSVWTD